MEKKEVKNFVFAVSFMSFISSSIIGGMFLGYYLGKWVGEFFGLGAYVKVIGLALGMFFSFWSVMKHIKTQFTVNKDKKDDVNL